MQIIGVRAIWRVAFFALVAIGCDSKAGQDRGSKGPNKEALPFPSSELNPRLVRVVEEGNVFKRGGLDVDQWSNDQIRLTYTFNPGSKPSSDEAEVTGVGIAKLTLNELVEDGFSPHDHGTAIDVRVQQKEKGAAGSGRVRDLGTATYAPGTEQINFELTASR